MTWCHQKWYWPWYKWLQKCHLNLEYLGSLSLTWINFNPGMPSKVWDEISNPYPNSNDYTVEVWDWIGWGIWRHPYKYASALFVSCLHDDVIKWKHFPRYWPFVWGIHRSPVNFHHKGQWRGALMFSLICAWINGRANTREAGETTSRSLWRHCNACLFQYSPLREKIGITSCLPDSDFAASTLPY